MDGNTVLLEWSKPGKNSNPDNVVWYYKIYKDDKLIAEVGNANLRYTDLINGKNKNTTYKVSAVNYYFKESESSSPFTLAAIE